MDLQEELDEIQNSTSRQAPSFSSTSVNAPRRGSSIFAAPDLGATGPYGRPAYLQTDNSHLHGALLVDFPGSGDDESKPENRGHGAYGEESYSKSGQSANRNAYYSDSDDEDYIIQSGRPGNGASKLPGAPVRMSEAARMEELANSQDLPGGPNHRPLVGGFAAAAYEAARAHHYSGAGKERAAIPKDRPPPPSI